MMITPWLRQLCISLSLQRSRFNPMPGNDTKWHWDRFSHKYVSYPLLLTFHQCSALTHSLSYHQQYITLSTCSFIKQNTGCFIMFSVITNIYNKKTKGPTLVELFTVTGNLKKFFWKLKTFDVCTTGDTAHINMIFKLLRHTRQHGAHIEHL